MKKKIFSICFLSISISLLFFNYFKYIEKGDGGGVMINNKNQNRTQINNDIQSATNDGIEQMEEIVEEYKNSGYQMARYTLYNFFEKNIISKENLLFKTDKNGAIDVIITYRNYQSRAEKVVLYAISEEANKVLYKEDLTIEGNKTLQKIVTLKDLPLEINNVNFIIMPTNDLRKGNTSELLFQEDFVFFYYTTIHTNKNNEIHMEDNISILKPSNQQEVNHMDDPKVELEIVEQEAILTVKNPLPVDVYGSLYINQNNELYNISSKLRIPSHTENSYMVTEFLKEGPNKAMVTFIADDSGNELANVLDLGAFPENNIRFMLHSTTIDYQK